MAELAESTVTVVVPVFNGGASLEALVQRLTATLEAIGAEYEIVLVNDGSRDDSWCRIGDLVGRYGRVRGIDLMRNYGQHNALLCGIRSARYDVVVTLDDDLQNPPEEIPRLLQALAAGRDVVYGTPRREQHGVLRDLASRITKLVLQESMGAETARNISAFRAFRTHLRDAFASYQSPFVSIDVLLTWGTTRFGAVKVDHATRRHGRSNYTIKKLFVHAASMITGFSTLPLQIAGMVGFAFTLFGIGVLVYVLGRYLLDGGSVEGFAFLASIVAIFSGAQMFALGIMGEYLARMHVRSMDRPVYAVRERVAGDDR